MAGNMIREEAARVLAAVGGLPPQAGGEGQPAVSGGRAMRGKPPNQYRKDSLIWAVYEGDWSDLTAAEIAQVLDVLPQRVRSAMAAVRRETGWRVPHRTEPPWRGGCRRKHGENGGRYRY